MPIELARNAAAVHAQLFRSFLGQLADQRLDLLLLRVLRPRDELFVRDDLRRHGRIDALVQIALPLGNPHAPSLLSRVPGKASCAHANNRNRKYRFTGRTVNVEPF